MEGQVFTGMLIEESTREEMEEMFSAVAGLLIDIGYRMGLSPKEFVQRVRLMAETVEARIDGSNN